jgi:hypothetical protein
LSVCVFFVNNVVWQHRASHFYFLLIEIFPFSKQKYVQNVMENIYKKD